MIFSIFEFHCIFLPFKKKENGWGILELFWEKIYITKYALTALCTIFTETKLLSFPHHIKVEMQMKQSGFSQSIE